MYLAGYNLLRTLMNTAAIKAGVPVARISFQGCRQRLVATAANAVPARHFKRLYRRMIRDLAKDQNPDRPDRIETRAVKRRPKQYDRLNKPREILRKRLMGGGLSMCHSRLFLLSPYFPLLAPGRSSGLQCVQTAGCSAQTYFSPRTTATSLTYTITA